MDYSSHHFGKGLAAMVFSLALFIPKAGAQNLSLSTNLLEWADLGTINADVDYSVDRHWSLSAGGNYNPFLYGQNSGSPVSRREQVYSLGTRFWPWHVYSGVYLGTRLQYQEFNTGGLRSSDSREGDRYGAGLYAGYAKMLGTHLNLEFGLGAWTGHETYTVYSCPVCGRVISEGEKVFFLPDEFRMSVAYIF